MRLRRGARPAAGRGDGAVCWHPVNAGGGLLARGHPLGATGVAQVVEVTRHLAGRTGTLARRPDAGRTHCTGGGISGYDQAATIPS